KPAQSRVSAARRPGMSVGLALSSFVFLLFLVSLVVEARWPFEARLVPQVVSSFGALFSAVVVWQAAFKQVSEVVPGDARAAASMTLQETYGTLPQRVIYGRAGAYFLWILAILLGGYVVGVPPALGISTLLFIRFHARAPWLLAIVVSVALVTSIGIIFDHF